MGQFIYVMPKEDLVVTFVSELDDRDFYTPQELLFEYIIPAVKSDKSLPENQDGVSRMNALDEALGGP
jgi:hypothetical protein